MKKIDLKGLIEKISSLDEVNINENKGWTFWHYLGLSMALIIITIIIGCRLGKERIKTIFKKKKLTIKK